MKGRDTLAELDRATDKDIERLDREPELMEIYVSQAKEWEAISNEMIAARPGEPVTAYQVSLEQRKRLLARGEVPWFKRQKAS